MKLRTLNKLAFMGFFLLYFASVGSLVVLVMPILAPIRETLLWYVMLPAGIMGAAMIVFEKAQKPDEI